LTPPSVRLISCNFNKGSAVQKTDASGKPVQDTDSVDIEGIVSGERSTLDSSLGQYVVLLGNSPLFKEVHIRKQEIVKLKGNEVLHFTINAKMG